MSDLTQQQRTVNLADRFRLYGERLQSAMLSLFRAPAAASPAPQDSLAIVLKRGDTERRIPLRMSGPRDAFLIGLEHTEFKFADGAKKRLRAAGLPRDDQQTPSRFYFRWQGGERLLIEGQGAENLSPKCRVRIHLYDEAGAPLLSKSVRVGTDPWFDMSLPPVAGRGTFSITLYDEGVYRPLTFELRLLRARADGKKLTPKELRIGRDLDARGQAAWTANDFAAVVENYEALSAFEVLSAAASRRLRTGLRKQAESGFSIGDFAGAATFYERCAAWGDLDRRSVLRRAAVLRALGRTDEADNVLTEAFGAASTDAEVWKGFIKNAEAAANWLEVHRRWRQAIELTGSPQMRLAFISMLERRGGGEGVVEQLRLAIESSPDDLVLQHRLIVALRRAGQWSDCLARIDQLLPTAPADMAQALMSTASDCLVDRHEQGEGSREEVKDGDVALLPEPRTQREELKRWVHYLELGMDERALEELAALAERGATAIIRSNAAWHLCQWHMAQGDAPSAKTAWNWLKVQRRTDIKIAASDWVEVELLTRLGQLDDAERLWREASETNPGGNLALAGANLIRERGGSDVERLEIVNAIFRDWALSPLSLEAGEPLTIDTIDSDAAAVERGPLVSIVMPLHNAGASLYTALRSIQKQTWRNIEVIIVDDASTDDSRRIAETFARADPRFRVIVNVENRGAYFSRNAGLQAATGEFATCHDGDDWSHPRKIELQVADLGQHAYAIGNMSRCVTATSDMYFKPRTRIANAFRWNFSSLLFRRQAVIDAAGYWDDVRFGADGEFVARLRKAFGKYAIRKLAAGPLSIVRQSTESLTGHASMGINARGMSLRKVYQDRFSAWHAADMPSHHVLASANERRFAVPQNLRDRKHPSETRFDVLLASDFRLTGGTTASNVQEILAQKAAGLRTGLVQLYSSRLKPTTPLSPKILELVDDDMVQLITIEQEVSADLAVVRWPPCAVERNHVLPTMKADKVVIVANQTPLRGGDGSEQLYDPETCGQRVAEMFGQTPTWWPIGPMARDGVEPWKDRVALSEADWVNVIDLAGWRVKTSRPDAGRAPVIGRHARDFAGKWPMRPEVLLAVYPDSEDMQVDILGGAKVAEGILGYRPANWRVQAFDSAPVQDYLEGLDVFVYFPDDSLSEAFGRTILEAMAAGVPVILPSRFEAVFGPGAIYCEPEDIRAEVLRITQDPEVYTARVEAGLRFAADHSHARHIERLDAQIGR